jgi:uncharacterized protein (TIGR02594 family)
MATPEQIVAAAVHELGVRESPNGSNDGAQVRRYQSITGAYRAPWCASFVQWVLTSCQVGPIANRTASAYYMGDYARSHGWTRPTPAPGCVVVYHIGQGHVGIVEKPSANGTFFAIEGNENNGVNRVLRRMSEVYCIFTVPGTKPKPRRVQVPRFEVVSSSGGHAQVRAVWGKWSKVGPQIPRLAAKYRDVRVRRKIVTVTR